MNKREFAGIQSINDTRGGFSLVNCISTGAPFLPGTFSAGTSSSGTSSSDSTAKPSPSALDQRADELLEKNIKSLKTSLGEGERISEVRETIKENFDVKNPGEEFELIKNIEREVNLNDKKCEGEKMQSSLNEVTEKKGECPITIIELNEIKNHEALTQDGKGGGKPTDCSFQEKGKADE